MPEVIIDISPAGSVKVDAQGFQGKSCTEATEQIEIVLGGAQAKKKHKPEYYAPAVAGTQANKMTF